MNTQSTKSLADPARRAPDYRQHVTIVSGRPRFFGSRWQCQRVAQGYSKAARAFVRVAQQDDAR